MKKAAKKLITIVMTAIMVLALAIPVAATGFDFEYEIANFKENSLNTITLEPGDTHMVPGSTWLSSSSTRCYISQSGVVEVDGSSGIVTAVGEGTVYVAIVASENVYMVTRYQVVKAKQETTSSTTNNINPINGLHDDAESMTGGFFSGFSVLFAVIMAFIVAVFVVVIASIIRSRKLDSAMQTLAANPCQANAEKAVKTFNETSALIRGNLSLGGDSRGTHFTMWRHVFNGVVIPAVNINATTKEALKQELVRFGTYGLYNVVAIKNQQEVKEVQETFGAEGEDNVWHNLKTIPNCDVYRNVRINNGATSSEIDAVIVSEEKGIFLVEIKSLGGKRGVDGKKYITYDLLKEDPTNQIIRHQYDFMKCFADTNINDKIKNVLVFSWPKGDERRFVSANEFPTSAYDIITIEQLLRYFDTQSTAGITRGERAKIGEKLKSCSAEYILH